MITPRHYYQPRKPLLATDGSPSAMAALAKAKEQVRMALIGAGAANIAVSRVLIATGFPPEQMIMVDSQGTLHKGRSDLRTLENRAKWHMCEISNQEGRTGGISEALRDADVCIALSRSGPGTIRPQWIAAMARDAIVFACANPVPEIWPWEAEAAGARIVATGRSDFPNQVNNSLGFPAIFRGVLDVAARKITDEMCIAAAEELARCVDDQDLSEAYILPRMDEWEVFPRQAAAVGLKAIEQGVARIAMSRGALFDKASRIITRAREETRALMEAGIIATTARA